LIKITIQRWVRTGINHEDPHNTIIQSVPFLLPPLEPKHALSPLLRTLKCPASNLMQTVKDFRGFRSGAAEDSVPLIYDSAPMNNRIPTFRRNMVTSSRAQRS
jgi:hypothetical protein